MEKFYGQFDPSVDEFIFKRYFPDKDIKGVFVECGAYDGLTECSCKFFEESMGWQGYNIEPLPWTYEKLCKNRPASVNLNVALSNKTGDAVFKAVNHPQFGTDCTNGSLDHTEAHKKWLDDMGCTYVDVPVRLQTWPDFVAQNNIRHIDLRVLDVEGHELSVLEGMQGSSVLPDVICIEFGHQDLTVIRDTLGKLGYQYDISSFGNAYFVRADKIALFALRRCESASIVAAGMKNVAELARANSENATLKERVKELETRSAEAEARLSEIFKSKGWRLVQTVRELKGRLRP